ncbi:hypothetical protein M9978_21125 [Sphingomonas sp. MG17]|uniref:Uncharacterized protein n=1 Tax=Sphingomonas tagetis TaxID=2949092 RepID=A0A9X2HL67_9SPHN|nr:hypothetical protein [Sphingomonas tagetis]MCP3732923.1 hypothetical protein [Sphingomonas tagetis]
MTFSLAMTLLNAATPTCALPFRTVPDEASARRIAEVVSKVAPDAPGANAPYSFDVKYIEERDEWVVAELPQSRMLGGDGLWMWINACNGQVSGLIRQR